MLHQPNTFVLPEKTAMLPSQKNDHQLCEMIRQGGSVRERANRIIQTRYLFLVRQVGVRHLHLSYEEATMVYTDALVELDQKISCGEEFEHVGKMLYTLVYRRGVDALRRRTTKGKVEPLSQSSNVVDLPEQLFDALHYSEENIQELFQHEDETEEHERRQRILACIKMALDTLPPKRRALLINRLDGYDYEELVLLHHFKTERVAHEMVSRSMENLRQTLKEICRDQHPACCELCAWLRRKHF
ncbi:MAG: hypothetical protein NZM43_05075 [Saprospiraceae bacterium]|nr:hypothetical protein [Saprospiraceae bacterium]MDW8483681.1 hypothetical protein [Saprospiraceae bacterium]